MTKTRADRSRANWEIKVRLHVIDSPLSHDEITKLVGVKPTRTQIAGNAIPSGTKKPVKVWTLEAVSDRSAPLHEHIESLMALMKPATSHLQKISRGASVLLSCVIYDFTRDVALGFSKEAVESLGAMGAEIDIDYYDLSGVDKHAQPVFEVSKRQSMG
jgi:hypothetical protein